MDAKDLRTGIALSERSNDGNKYAQSGTIQCNKNKSYHDVGSNSSVKVDTPNGRPCAVIGPDRVLPPPHDPSDTYLKKASVEPWPCQENTYQRPPEYLQKIASYQNPARNISPRQTFQENMQRIMLAPTYNTVKVNNETSYFQLPDKNNPPTNTSKMSISSDNKYCDVPYTVIPTNSDSKNIKNVDMCAPTINPNITRVAPQGWQPNTINVRSQRPYATSDVYPYPEYPSCAGPRHVPLPHMHRGIPEETGYMYPEAYYQETNIRFKPYLNVKERYQQSRYDYINNYSNPYHLPTFPSNKYELPKAILPHPYPGFPHLKYVESRLPEPVLDGFQRPINQQSNYNMQYRNPVIHPVYGPMTPNCSQNKLPPFPPDSSSKSIPSNKLSYDNNSKMYGNYDNSRIKPYPPVVASDNFYANEASRLQVMKNQGIIPNYSPMTHTISPHSHYKKDNSLLKTFDHPNNYKNINQSINFNSPGSHHLPQFSPSTLAISPTDSITSNDTIKTQTTQEDSGYVSQSSTASIRSIDSGIPRINGFYGRYDYRCRPVIRTSLKSNIHLNVNSSVDVKQKKEIDVRQFLQMWNEGDDENMDSHPNRESTQSSSIDIKYLSKPREAMTSQEQLYVLGSVNVPSEELSKYQHIQRVSKLPENIKGYSNIELLNQFEEVIESTNVTNMKKFHLPSNGIAGKASVMIPRPVSPLDVEAKISQSVIHKEVGCNFEIKPCSPKMLNVEIAAPAHNILAERVIEKVTNPLSTIINSPILPRIDENVNDCTMSKMQDKLLKNSEEISSCKMINTEFSPTNNDAMKNTYTVQDLESNLGVCLASLPRLDSDIELNFPEVNQQFINANRGEKSSSTLIKDLPELDEIAQPNNIHIETVTSENKVQEGYPLKSITDTEFRKLSQYRKTKLCDLDNQDEKIKCTVVRTDSVIIKNPENAKIISMSKCEESDDPINLKSHNEITDKNGDDFNETIVNIENENCPITEIALDFSVHKNNDSYFNDNDCNLELKTLKESPLPTDTLNKNNISNNPDIFYNCDNNESIECNVIPCPYTSVSGQNDIKSMLEPLNHENSIRSLNKNIKNKKQVEESYTSEAESTVFISTSNDPNDIMSKDDKMDETLTDTTNIKITKLKKKYVTKNNLPNDLVNQNLEINYLTETIRDTGNIPEGINLEENNFIEDGELVLDLGNVSDVIYDRKKDNDNQAGPISTNKNDDMKQLNSNSKNVEQNMLENTFHTISEPENRNDIKNEIKFAQHQENSKLEQHFLKDERKMVQCEEREFEISSNIQHDKLQKKILDPKLSSSDEEICKDATVMNEVQNISCQNHDFQLSLMDDITTALETYKSRFHKSEIRLSYSDCNKKFGYIGKKLYSPWIQKLLSFHEGPCSIFQPIEKTLINNMVEGSQILPVAINEVVTSSDTDTTLDVHKEQLGTILVTNDNGIEEYLDSIEYKSDTISTKAPFDVISSETKETNEGLDNPVVKLSHSSEMIYSKDCLNVSNIQEEKPLTVDETSNKKEEIFWEANLDKAELLTSNANKLITTLNFNNIKIIEDNNEISQDASKNDLNIIHMHELNHNMPHKSLKRSLSDSAINRLRESFVSENISCNWQFKRKKINDIESTVDSNEIAQKLCNILQNRRNSISSIYNDENVSFCILIDNNCIITEEEDEKDQICYEDYSEDCLEVTNNLVTEEKVTGIDKEEITYSEENQGYSESFMLECDQEKSSEESWIQDVACVETIVNDDIAEDIVISAHSSPNNIDFSDTEESSVYSVDLSEHTEKVRHIYGDKMSSDDAHFVETLYNTPQMDVNKTLYISRESHIFNQSNRYYDTESLEKILSETNNHIESSALKETTNPVLTQESFLCCESTDNIHVADISTPQDFIENDKILNSDEDKCKLFETTENDIVNACESSINHVFSSCKSKDETTHFSTSSSPEVSSTTSEERNSSILLKITNYMGSITSQINEVNVNSKSCCKFTETNDYLHSDGVLNSTRPFITKAAQKYIPPLKESVHDLKVKLSLPHQSLMKLKQLKISKDKPKLVKNKKIIPITPKKPKPLFEDVLKSIDEIQFKRHKEKHKKNKKYIPKVVIKKNENGSHYASSSNQDTYNPDLTGRKWQPWVFLEKNIFIDKMALKNKTKAVFNYRKNTYVLSEKFCKYKSVNSTKFFISPPDYRDSSTGQLKYTIRLKHNY